MKLNNKLKKMSHWCCVEINVKHSCKISNIFEGKKKQKEIDLVHRKSHSLSFFDEISFGFWSTFKNIKIKNTSHDNKFVGFITSRQKIIINPLDMRFWAKLRSCQKRYKIHALKQGSVRKPKCREAANSRYQHDACDFVIVKETKMSHRMISS